MFHVLDLAHANEIKHSNHPANTLFSLRYAINLSFHLSFNMQDLQIKLDLCTEYIVTNMDLRFEKSKEVPAEIVIAGVG